MVLIKSGFLSKKNFLLHLQAFLPESSSLRKLLLTPKCSRQAVHSMQCARMSLSQHVRETFQTLLVKIHCFRVFSQSHRNRTKTIEWVQDILSLISLQHGKRFKYIQKHGFCFGRSVCTHLHNIDRTWHPNSTYSKALRSKWKSRYIL